MSSKEVLLSPAAFIGMFIGLMLNDARREGHLVNSLQNPKLGGGIAILFAIYLFLTYWIFQVRKDTFKLNYNQLRVAWIGAFILGAILTPVIYEIAYR